MKTSPDKEEPCSVVVSQCLEPPLQQRYQSSLSHFPEMGLNSGSFLSTARKNINLPKCYSPNGEQRHIKFSQHSDHSGSPSRPSHKSAYTWERNAQYQEPPNRPPRPSLELKSPQFADQFDAYLYQSQHITTPILTPQLTLDFHSEESSRQPSRQSNTTSAYSNQLLPDILCPTPDQPPYRRASHSGNFSQQQGAPAAVTHQSALLNVPISRCRGSSLPENLSSCDLYRLRNFSISGKKVINNGDSYKSRNSSISSVGSR